jgi:hypothetical protein
MADTAHGRFRDAVAFNAAGPAIFLFVVLQACYRAAIVLGFRVRARAVLLQAPFWLICFGVLMNFAFSLFL